ncbi:LOW QUALITY PROTEIN: hypothetical protein KUTeg_004578 [Tegillarca granosa]|uniref:Uncharacterized protein n=1 Tax=Tegillarca granosa TaxID=220873 RepID=A0ABQ9FS25_TEGGR|nr:LOW QUALITY PROTEIN: hypothetical protein KUTeg_004578 [Tegillarca granosa]
MCKFSVNSILDINYCTADDIYILLLHVFFFNIDLTSVILKIYTLHVVCETLPVYRVGDVLLLDVMYKIEILHENQNSIQDNTCSDLSSLFYLTLFSNYLFKSALNMYILDIYNHLYKRCACLDLKGTVLNLHVVSLWDFTVFFYWKSANFYAKTKLVRKRYILWLGVTVLAQNCFNKFIKKKKKKDRTKRNTFLHFLYFFGQRIDSFLNYCLVDQTMFNCRFLELKDSAISPQNMYIKKFQIDIYIISPSSGRFRRSFIYLFIYLLFIYLFITTTTIKRAQKLASNFNVFSTFTEGYHI